MDAPRAAILIKKYSNRRLYDTSESRYITLDDLAEKVRSGVDIRVVDAKSEADLTRQVLTQVILEQQDRLDVIPVELLHGIIRVQGTLRQAPLTAFLSNLAASLSDTGNQLAKQMSDMFQGFAGLGFPAWPAGGASPAPQSEPKRAEPPPPAAQAEMSDLRKRMDELLQRLDDKKDR